MSLLDQIDSDLDTFINDDDFAIEAIYTPKEGDSKIIKVIFDDAYKQMNIQTGVESGGTSATVKDSDIEGITKGEDGDTLEINDIVYSIIGVEPDGTGMTILRLSED
jgi:hypothetical protein